MDVPLKAALITCVPVEREDVFSVTTPFDTFAMVLPLIGSESVTVPFRGCAVAALKPPEVTETLIVMVTGLPNVVVEGELEAAVAVDAGFTVKFTGEEVDLAKLASPLYAAVMTWPPPRGPAYGRVATLFVTPAEPTTDVMPLKVSENATWPEALPGTDPVIVAVSGTVAL